MAAVINTSNKSDKSNEWIASYGIYVDKCSLFALIYFCQSLYTLQRGLPAIAGLLVNNRSNIKKKIYFTIIVCVY